MGETPLSERQSGLLAVVAEGSGDWDARRIDLTADARYGPGVGTVLRELEELQQLGLVVRDDSRSGAGGRWKVTAAACQYLADRDDVPGHAKAALPEEAARWPLGSTKSSGLRSRNNPGQGS